MIGRLVGSVVEVEGNLVLLDVQGVGYEVTVPDSCLPKLPPNSPATLYTRQIFREDGVSLCGFLERKDRHVFDLLLDVKGCGPKVAQALVGQVGTEEVLDAIFVNDPKTLARANGVGQRLAERIILELKPKLDQLKVVLTGKIVQTPVISADTELVEALIALGYRRPDAESAALKTSITDNTETRLKVALKLLSR
jgi:Holliday junction DNA helicase RuvA